MPLWASWSWREKYLPPNLHTQHSCFTEAVAGLETAACSSFDKGMSVAVLGFGLLLRECKRAQEVEADDPGVADLDFLLNSRLGVERMEDILTSIGSVLSRLEKNGGEGLKKAGDNTVEQADELIQPTADIGKKRKNNEKMTVGKKMKRETEKGAIVDKQDRESSKRRRIQTKRALGEAL